MQLAPDTDRVAGPHELDVLALCTRLRTDPQGGLSEQEAAARLHADGPNELQERPGPGPWQLLVAQFNNFLVYLLVAAAGISIFLGEIIDASAILAIVALNALLGVFQEYRANKALAALKQMAAPLARAVRNGQVLDVPTRELVRGDVVLLEAGNYVPADLRLTESVNLRIEEAALTGESEPVEKDAGLVFPTDAGLGDRRNCAYMGTLVSYGRGRGLVVETGMQAEVGKIAEMLQAVEEEMTPLQRKLEELGKVLGTLCIGVAAIVFLLGIGRAVFSATEESMVEIAVELLLTAVSLAIAAVPEGLPAIVTVALAIGMQRMVRRNALIRKLPAVETLGSASFICSDKTGTLTQNEMSVTRIYTGGRRYTVTGRGYDPIGDIRPLGGEPVEAQDQALVQFLRCGLLCNDALLQSDSSHSGHDGREGTVWRVVGDPTEGALIVLAAKAGLWQDESENLPRIAEVPFDSNRKRMSTVHADAASGQVITFLKGAPDVVLGLCRSVLVGGELRELTSEIRAEILAHHEEMASEALRVLGLACRRLPERPSTVDPAELERDCTFLGLAGMIDAARPEAQVAVSLCKSAGIRPVMITGDFLTTATAIADELGLLRPEGKVLTGAQLEEMSDAEFIAQVEEIDVYARVSPEHKMRIVDALMHRGHVVAMTGDGVNDAPALKRANIGVAMGITGTDVTKETADMVLTDDNFASIVAAVEEGRVIYANIRQFVYYLLSANVGEVLLVFVAMLIGLPLVLRPIHLLTLNLLTDGAPALALGVERGEPDIMRRPPRPAAEGVLTSEMRWLIAVQGVALAAASLAAFILALTQFPDDLLMAQTVAFATVVCGEILRAYSARSERWALWSIGVFSNRFMILASGVSIAILLLTIYVPVLHPVFDTRPLPLEAWYIVAPLSFVSIVAAEAGKAVLRWRARARAA
jgi:P-type Ca2+ transporter type 2C